MAPCGHSTAPRRQTGLWSLKTRHSYSVCVCVCQAHEIFIRRVVCITYSYVQQAINHNQKNTSSFVTHITPTNRQTDKWCLFWRGVTEPCMRVTISRRSPSPPHRLIVPLAAIQTVYCPVRVFKLATLTFNAKQFGKPAYVSGLLHEYQPARTLQSSSPHLLLRPFTSTSSCFTFLLHCCSKGNKPSVNTKSEDFCRQLAGHQLTIVAIQLFGYILSRRCGIKLSVSDYLLWT